MKFLIFLSLFVFGLNSFAEVKPEGSLLTLACGGNKKSSTAQFPNFNKVLTVCLVDVVAGQNGTTQVEKRPIVSVTKADPMAVGPNAVNTTQYYVVLGNVETANNVWTWQAYKLNTIEDGGYKFIDQDNIIDWTAPMLEMTKSDHSVIGVSMGILEGDHFEVELQLVPQTKTL